MRTDLGRWMLVVVVISVDAYPFLVFSDLTCHLKDTGIGIFCFHCATPSFPNELVKIKFDFIVRSVENWLREMNVGGSCD